MRKGWSKEPARHSLAARGCKTRQVARKSVVPEGKKPYAPLIGQDKNIYNLMAIASRTLRNAGMNDQNKEMLDRIEAEATSYEVALAIIMDYVDPMYKGEIDPGRGLVGGKVEYSTKIFQFEHGASPRGKGSWAFKIGGQTLWFPSKDGTGNSDTYEAAEYRDAKAAAIEYAKKHGYKLVELLS